MKSTFLPTFPLMKFRLARPSRMSEKAFLFVSTITILLGSPIAKAASLTWSGAVNQNWTTGGVTNWLNGGTPAAFATSDTVLFDDTASGSGTVTVAISAANVSPGSTTFNNSTRDYILNGPSGITTGNFTKNGAGKLTLNAALSAAAGQPLGRFPALHVLRDSLFRDPDG